MTDNEKSSATAMSDNEIIKTWNSYDELLASGAEYHVIYDEGIEKIRVLIKNTLDLIEGLINGQTLQKALAEKNAEIERLQTDNSSMQSTLAKMSMGVADARTEAIKEFAERLKSCAHEISCNELLVVTKDDIDNLVKEMVGDTE